MSGNECPWILIDPENRWLPAVRRFLPLMLPPGSDLTLFHLPADEALQKLAELEYAVVLWAYPVERFLDCMRCVITTNQKSPKAMQWVGTSHLSPVQRSSLLELGVTTQLEHPEQLPKWSATAQRYFAQLS